MQTHLAGIHTPSASKSHNFILQQLFRIVDHHDVADLEQSYCISVKFNLPPVSNEKAISFDEIYAF